MVAWTRARAASNAASIDRIKEFLAHKLDAHACRTARKYTPVVIGFLAGGETKRKKRLQVTLRPILLKEVRIILVVPRTWVEEYPRPCDVVLSALNGLTSFHWRIDRCVTTLLIFRLSFCCVSNLGTEQALFLPQPSGCAQQKLQCDCAVHRYHPFVIE